MQPRAHLQDERPRHIAALARGRPRLHHRVRGFKGDLRLRPLRVCGAGGGRERMRCALARCTRLLLGNATAEARGRSVGRARTRARPSPAPTPLTSTITLPLASSSAASNSKISSPGTTLSARSVSSPSCGALMRAGGPLSRRTYSGCAGRSTVLPSGRVRERTMAASAEPGLVPGSIWPGTLRGLVEEGFVCGEGGWGLRQGACWICRGGSATR